jgi:hypothetical protein
MDTELQYYMTPEEAEKLLSRSVEIGFQRGLETAGVKSKYITQNKAYALFRRSRVEHWVQDGLIRPKYSGNGKTSTIWYEYAQLLKLDVSTAIVIRKGYTGKSWKEKSKSVKTE